MPPKEHDGYRCHLCQSTDLEIAEDFSGFKRVTSDCKPWPEGGVLARCRSCELVQNITTPKWKQEIQQIYTGYTIYHQSGGIEQMVFVDGQPVARSEVIGKLLTKDFKLPSKGRLLDIGCGNGAFLKVCSSLLPGWRLCGCEFDGKYKSLVESIPNVEAMFTEDLSRIPGTFDLISLIHVIEHVPSPLELLQLVYEKLNPGGFLVIEVPDCLANAYMLLVADHCSHFSSGALSKLAAAAGFEVLHCDTKCVRKEITLVARKSEVKPEKAKTVRLDESEGKKVFANSEWLKQVVMAANSVTNRPQLGIFGSSIAATWLQAQINNSAKFFVDEDTHRAGRSHMGVPIFMPSEVPEPATVIVPLPKVVAEPIIQRLQATKKSLDICVP